MRKENINTEFINNEKKYKKSIIKRINETVHTKNFKKIETNRNRKINLYLNNDSNPNCARTEHFIDLPSQNINSNKIQSQKSNNIFLENNAILLNSKKTRNKIINFRQINEQNSLSKKTVGVFNFKNIFSTNLNSKRNKNKSKKELMNMSHQSCDEEMSRKFYLNPNFNKIYLKCLKKIKPQKETEYSERDKTKYNDDIYYRSKNNSIINENKYFQSYNNGYLSTKEKSNLENTYGGNYSNSIKTTKNNGSPIITSFSYRNNKYTYKKVNISISNQQRKKYKIDSNENKANNISINNIQNEGDKLLTKKRIGFNIYKKHYASKSQENIKENSSKYKHLFNKKNIPILKKTNSMEYYKRKMNYIIKIQKWWKDMLFHMYIEKKIIFIQKYYRMYLKKQMKRIKIQLNYVYNIDKILLIQKVWKRILKSKRNKELKNNYKNDLPKIIPFKLDNFDINEITDSNRDTKNEDLNKNKQINIYLKKSMGENKRKIRKNNTMSNFYEYKKYNYETTQEINFSLITNKKNHLSKLELQKMIDKIKINKNDYIYKVSKNTSLEIINNLYQSKRTNFFIGKEYNQNKRIILNKAFMSKTNYYITKLIFNKNHIIDSILLIQKCFKNFIKAKKYKYIIKPKLSFAYNSKIRKVMNLLDLSSHNRIENFSFKGNYFIVNSNSNKDKISEIDISNSKSEKTNSFYDRDRQKHNFSYNNNFFSFENSGNKFNNKDSLQTLLLKDKLKTAFNKYFLSKFKFQIKSIINNIRYIKFIIILKKFINNKIKNIIIKQLKNHIFHNNCITEQKNNIFDEDDIKNIINRKRIIKYKPKSNFLIMNQNKGKNTSAPKEYYINDEEGLANYILNYFFNEKKFTNININLIKERLSKSPLIYRTQSNIKNYINDLHQDIIENKICNNCFCKFEENCDIDCSCHIKEKTQINKPKGGISIYRQKINKIIKDNKRNIKTIKNNDENKNENNFFMFNCMNKNNMENGNIEFNNNTKINRYDTDSAHSKSRSISKE